MLKRTTHVLMEVVVALAVVFVLAVAGGLWRLSQGPVSVAFLTPYFQEMLQPIPSVRVELRDTILKWSGWRRPVDVRVVGVTATGKDGRLIAGVPEISLRLSFRALLRGEFEPTHLAVIGPNVRLRRLESGAFQIGIGTASSDTEMGLGAFVDALLAPPRPGAPLRYLAEIDFVDGALSVDDRHLGLSWGAPRFEFALIRRRDGVTLEFDLQTDLGNQTPRLQGVAVYAPQRREFDIDFNFESVWPSRLAEKAPVFRHLKYADLPLSGSAQLSVGRDGAFTGGTLQMVGQKGRVDVPGVLRRPLAIKSLRMRAALKPSPERFVLEEFVADLGGPRLNARAVMTIVDGVASINGDATVSDLPVGEVHRNWPPGVSPSGYAWVSRNITKGMVKSARVQIISQARLDRGEFQVSSFSGDMRLEDLSVHYYRPLQEVTGVSARARFGAESLSFQVLGGDVAGVDVTGGTAVISGLSQGKEQLDIDLRLEGPLRNVLRTLDHPRLGYIRAMGLDPARIGGNSLTRLSVKMPLLSDLPIEKVVLRADSDLKSVSAPSVVLGQDMTEGDLTLKLDLAGMLLAGSATIGGVRSDVSVDRRFHDTTAYVARSTLKATIDAADLPRFGLDLPSVASGPAAWDLHVTERRDKSTEVVGEIDLRETNLSISFLNWSKSPGTDGKAAFLLRSEPEKGLNLERLTVTGKGFELAGNALFGAAEGWPFESAVIEKIHIGETQVNGTMSRGTPNGPLRVALTGKVFDAGPILAASPVEEPTAKEPGSDTASSNETSAPIEVTATLDRVLLGKGRALASVSGSGSMSGGRLRQVEISTVLGTGRDASISIRTEKGEQTILIRSNDAGALLSRLKVIDSIKGGQLIVSGKRGVVATPTSWTGKALIKDFQAVRAPALAQVLTLASLSGIGNTLRGQGIKFTRLEVPFSYGGEKLKIKNARSVGSQLGLTGDGVVDFAADSIEFKGTIVPAYTLNSLLSNIPIIREIFTGSSKPGGGVFAVSYAVSGNIDKPQTSVNPLSALAPGFLRGIVDMFSPTKPGTDLPSEPVPQD